MAWAKKRTDPFYQSARWTRKRAAILRRDGYMCRESARFGKRVEANTVHHIFPRDRVPEYQWEDWNLISLSWEIHELMHDRTIGDLSAKGAELLRRIARRQGIEVPMRYKG